MADSVTAGDGDVDRMREVVKEKRPRNKAKITKRVMRFAERLNRRHARFGDVPVLDNADFPWVAEVEPHWRPVRAELERLLQRQAELPAFNEVVGGSSSVSHDLRRDRGWKSFFFIGYGLRFERNIAQCPETWRVLQKIPNVKTAMFSILEPGKQHPLAQGPLQRRAALPSRPDRARAQQRGGDPRRR